MLENLTVDYELMAKQPAHISGYIEPEVAVMYLKTGIVPEFIFNADTFGGYYRDAVLHELTTKAYPAENHTVLTLFAQVFNTNNDKVKLRILAEYAVPLAFALGEKELAVKFLTRTDPKLASGWLKISADAMRNRMDSAIFKGMLADSTNTGANDWQARKAHYGF